MSKGLKLSEILVTVLIAVVFTIIITYGGLHIMWPKLPVIYIGQLTYGVWFMAAIVCVFNNSKPGIALIAEFAAGAGETIVMGKFDIPTIVYAILQGLACEIILLYFQI